MKVKINIDRTGFDDFYSLFNMKETLKKDDIDKLFDTPSYRKMVDLFGEDVRLTEKAQFGKNEDFTKKEPWTELFFEAYELHLNASQNSTETDPVKKNIIDAVLWALNNLDNLNKDVEKLIEIINKKQFVLKALKYLPQIESDVEIKMDLYVFMINACVEGGEMLLDVSFASRLTEDQLNDLLAHELHHYLKDQIISVYKRPKEGYKDVTNSLFALENEGIADMCSFEGLSFIYEFLGFAEKGTMKNVLSNSTVYLKQFGKLLRDKLISNDNTVELYSFLSKNQIFHPLGYSMASKIEKVLGIEGLRKCAGYPLEFLLKYQEALYQSSQEKIFDEEAIERLKEIYE